MREATPRSSAALAQHWRTACPSWGSFADNVIMILAGDAIDKSIGLHPGILYLGSSGRFWESRYDVVGHRRGRRHRSLLGKNRKTENQSSVPRTVSITVMQDRTNVAHNYWHHGRVFARHGTPTISWARRRSSTSRRRRWPFRCTETHGSHRKCLDNFKRDTACGSPSSRISRRRSRTDVKTW